MMSGSKRILMCSSSLDYPGGMTTVVKNYLAFPGWDEFTIQFVPTHVPGGKVRVLSHFALVLPRIFRALSNHEFDLVHLHVAERGSFFRKALIARRAKKEGIPVVFHHHAAEFEQFYASLDDKRKEYVRSTCEMVDVNIALSKSVKDMMLEHFPDARFEVLYNAVPTYPENHYNPSGKYIAFLGRVGERKGTFDLIRAFALTLPQIPDDYRLVICGDGEVEKARTLAGDLGISGRVQCRGWIGPDERSEVLCNAAINVLPSYNEGLPMSILEAMSYGVPTLSTRIAAIPEVIKPGENGWLIEPGDIEGMTSIISDAINDEGLRTGLSAKAYALVSSSFSLEPHIENVKEIYRSLC
ncbi:glycosyltransferase family 4 protein [Enorma massiliensis]|uniref:glycosyltransferase family 4 protein n=1 Tax=Enorma massiliensis TaxID=1472761 RepID=UPI00195E6A49|nr:glycosyltransferase family 4 protein [Enorma massiliensis]